MDSDGIVSNFAQNHSRVIEVYRGRIEGKENTYFFMTNFEEYNFDFADDLVVLSDEIRSKTTRSFTIIHLKFGDNILYREDLEERVFSKVS